MNNAELSVRMERMERELQRWRRAAMALIVGATVLGCAAASRQEEVPEMVTARGFDVVNEAGKIVASMHPDESGDGRLELYNSRGTRVVEVLADEAGSGRILVSNNRYRPVVRITVDQHGNGDLAVCNDARKSLVNLSADKFKGGLIRVFNGQVFNKELWRAPQK